METSHQTILDLAAQRGLIRPRDLDALELPSVALTRLVRQGLLVRVGRGLSARPDRSVSEHGTLAEVARKHPQAIVCLLSALPLLRPIRRISCGEQTGHTPLEIISSSNWV